ncbi:MAG: NAD(+) synthase [Clostridia bacterium]|nr:NAD(+) synthase [Clostridia bacterium]
MKHGFIKVAACSPKVRLGDPKHNADIIIEAIKKADEQGVTLIAFPELAMTGYTMGDLFEHEMLLDTVEKELIRIRDSIRGLHTIAVIGAPLRCAGKLLNCAVVIPPTDDPINIFAKQHLPNYGEFYEARQFTPYTQKKDSVYLGELGWLLPCGGVLEVEDIPNFVFGVEVCEDLWVMDPPSNELARNGALLIVNCSAGNEIIGKADYRKRLVAVQSSKTTSAYLYVSAGEGESTSDLVFSGHDFIYENGTLLAENKPFENGGELLITEIDLGRLLYERRRVNSFPSSFDDKRVWCLSCGYVPRRDEYEDGYGGYPAWAPENNVLPETKLTRHFDRNPFVPKDGNEMTARARDILTIQAMGLKRRIEQVHASSCQIGISGGLDSSLALLVCAEAVDRLGYDRSFIHAVTMPCFGTTARTKSNALRLCEALGVRCDTVDITETVRSNFKDIGHDESDHSVTYENVQARVRTLVLMNFANKENGMVIGTGDLSELALGWATYNGDHMSMYGVNCGVPKTLLKYVVRYYADHIGSEEVRQVLYDILDTPISPELLPPDEAGNITQITEDVVGPYELHDFFLYYVLRWGYPPAKLYRIAKEAFRGSEFSEEVILKWLKNFYRRFFTQQFKRNCLPDGPKVGSVCLSPRGDWRMPSDATSRIWLDELEGLNRIHILPKE